MTVAVVVSVTTRISPSLAFPSNTRLRQTRVSFHQFRLSQTELLYRPTQTTLNKNIFQLFDADPKKPIGESTSNNQINYYDEDDHESKTNDWMRWMMRGGTPRGTAKMIMREPEELGGLPRGDRYSSRDWFHNTITLPNSGILKAIRSPVLTVTSWATFLSLLRGHWMAHGKLATAALMHIPSAPHSLMMSALGLLLVFRTNSAYQRFNEGRVIWERIINTSRDLSRMIALYEKEIGLDKRRRLQRLLVAFPYLLRHRIRPNLVMRRLDDEQYRRDPENSILLYQDTGTHDNDPDAALVAQTEETEGGSRRKKRILYWVDKRTLPWRMLPGQEALEKCARAQNRPLWVCDRMAKEIVSVPDQDNFHNRERLTLLKMVDDLSRCIGGAERIHQTTVPLNYARHTLRALTVWLFTVPFAVVQEMKYLTGPILFIISWLLFGVYEIGYAIEDPFQGSLRLSILCDGIRRDVLGDENIRNSAFTLDDEEKDDDDEFLKSRQTVSTEEDATAEALNGNDLASDSLPASNVEDVYQ